MLADGLSRTKVDPGDYTLDRGVFQQVCKIFAHKNFHPLVDMFASPGNHQLPEWVSRWPHQGACAVNSLECPLSQFREVYANPPWKIILLWLLRLRKNPEVQCLTVIPYWVGSPWWPLLTRLQDRRFPAVLVNPRVGLFTNCLGQRMPPPQVGPPLCDVIREGLQRKQVPPENITVHLSGIKSLPRYNRAFQALWSFCITQGGDPLQLSHEAAASYILKFAQQNKYEARNAYSAFLLIPGWEHLRFTAGIRQAKKLWESAGEKYGDFWDAESILEKIKDIPCNFDSIVEMRDRAIIILRLLHLCRSIDLSRSSRSHSKLGMTTYWRLQRKGQKGPKWEALMDLEDRSLSPVFLLQRYVFLTQSQGRPGGPLFLSLTPPWKALSANSIGRITRQILQKLGVPMSVFGPHSTRGAGVKMFKKLGLSSDVVCELGQWKNTEAFAKHYLRIGAAQAAGTVLAQKFVHTVPSWRSVEKGGSSSPGRDTEPGRKDPPCDAQDKMGPTPPTQGACKGGGPKQFQFTNLAVCQLPAALKQ
jgi:hypothetical protein